MTVRVKLHNDFDTYQYLDWSLFPETGRKINAQILQLLWNVYAMLWTHANLPLTFVLSLFFHIIIFSYETSWITLSDVSYVRSFSAFPNYYFFLWNKLNNIFRYLMFAFISHAWNKTMQCDFKSYFSIYGNRLLLIIVVDTPIIPKDDEVIQPIGILHRHLTYWSIFCVCRRRIKQKSFD